MFKAGGTGWGRLISITADTASEMFAFGALFLFEGPLASLYKMRDHTPEKNTAAKKLAHSIKPSPHQMGSQAAR